MKSGGFHGKDLGIYLMKNTAFLVAMKFGRFHGEIHQISWQGLRYISDEKYSILGAMKSAEFHEIRRIPKWAKDPWSYFLQVTKKGFGMHEMQYLPLMTMLLYSMLFLIFPDFL